MQDQAIKTEALRASEEIYRTLVSTSPDAIAIADLEGRIILSNPAAAHMLGYENPEALRGMSAFVLIAPQGQDQAHQDLRRMRETGELRLVEHTLVRQDNSRLPVEINATVVRDASGRPSALIGVVRDISERKLAEERLRAEAARAEALLRVAGHINAELDLPTILRAVCEETARALRVAGTIAYLYSEQSAVLEPAAWSGVAREARDRLPSVPRASFDAVRQSSGGPFVVPDVQCVAGLPGTDLFIERNVRTLCVASMIRREDLIGALIVFTLMDERRFSADELALLQGIADQAAQAIANARLLEESRQQASRLAVLNRVAAAISASLDLDDLLEIVYREVTAAIPAEVFFLALYDSSLDELDYRLRVDKGVREPQQRRPRTAGLTGSIIASRRPRLIRNFEEEKDALPPVRVWGSMESPASWLGVPMLAGDQVVGVISVQAYRPNAYGPAEQQLLSTIADTVAVAIQNARLYQEARQELEQRYKAEERLRRANRALRVLSDCSQAVVRCANDADLLNAICEIVVDVGGYRMAWIGLAEQDEQKSVRPVAHAGHEAGFLQVIRPSWDQSAFERGPCGMVISTGEPYVVCDIAHETRFAPWRAEALQRGYGSALLLPLGAGRRVFGMLSIHAAEPDAFEAEEVTLLSELAADTAFGLLTLQTRAERERAEVALRQSEQRYQSLFLNSPVAMWEEDFTAVKAHLEQLRTAGTADFRAYFATHPEAVSDLWSQVIVRDANQAAVALFQAGQQPALLGPLRSPPDDSTELDVFREELIAIAAGQTSFESEVATATRAGEKLHAILRWSLGAGDESTYRRVLLSIIDITERERMEARLRDSEARYHSLLDNLPIAVYRNTPGPRGDFLMANAATLRMFGFESLEELKQTTASSLYVVPEERRAFSDRVLRDGAVTGFETRFRRRDGSVLWGSVTARLMRHEGTGEPAFFDCTLEDITDLKRAQEEHERLQAQLLQAQKMEAVGTLAGGVAHDFNNILTAIMGHANLAMRAVDPANPVYEDMMQIQLSAERAANLTRQLLLFSQKQLIQFVPLQLNNIIEGMLKMLRRLIGENILIRTELATGLWQVEGDAGTLEQVVLNLAVNGRDAMPEGGVLRIKTENVRLDDESVRTLGEGRPGHFVLLSIADTGIGMDRATRERIFEPFFTTKAPGKGSGLGLSVVHGIAQRHGGWITVESAPGKGAKFGVYLPGLADTQADGGGGTVLPAEARGHGERILLVEDEREVRDVATRALRAAGYEVVEASSAEEALDIFAQWGGWFDLIFSDVVLPGKSGLDLAEYLLTRRPAPKVVLASGYTDDQPRIAGIRDKGFRLVQKPYLPFELCQVVHEMLREGGAGD